MKVNFRQSDLFTPKFVTKKIGSFILLLYISKQMKRLSEVPMGKMVIIHSFTSDGIFIKLMEMGCVPGEKIKIEQVAPLGDPISISVAGYSLSLRLNEAENILVEDVK